MNLLLDTHVFIWLSEAPHRLSPKLLSALQDLANAHFVSIATIWEMQIKADLGKLPLPVSVRSFVASQQALGRFQILPILESQIWMLSTLPRAHRDPFDRLIIAQAIAENLTLVSEDAIFTHYPIKILQ